MVALDVMGGDYAPEQTIIGALNAAKKSIPLILVGPEDLIREHLDRHDSNWQNYPITICNAPSVIEMAEEPVYAVRHKKDSSIVKIIELVRTGQAKFAISAGNSGAVMVAANFILGRVENVDRPAIAGLLPTSTGKKFLALDLGANTDCKPHNLFQFAHLADDYVRNVLKIDNPKIALLSNGQEDSKGSLLTKDAFVLLKNSKLNFIGNLEPLDIFEHKADIVVCDGFSGNVFLKTFEGAFELLAKLVQKDLGESPAHSHQEYEGQAGRWFDKLTTSAISGNFVHKIAHEALGAGGAVLLGVKGHVVICHGNSSANVIENVLESYAKFFNMKC